PLCGFTWVLFASRVVLRPRSDKRGVDLISDAPISLGAPLVLGEIHRIGLTGARRYDDERPPRQAPQAPQAPQAAQAAQAATSTRFPLCNWQCANDQGYDAAN